MADLGIIGVAKMRFTADRCIGCGACVKACSHHAVGCLALKNGKAVKEESACIGCGECVLACPTLARNVSRISSGKSVWADAPVKDTARRQALPQLGD